MKYFSNSAQDKSPADIKVFGVLPILSKTSGKGGLAQPQTALLIVPPATTSGCPGLSDDPQQWAIPNTGGPRILGARICAASLSELNNPAGWDRVPRLGWRCRSGRVAPFLPRRLGRNGTAPGTRRDGLGRNGTSPGIYEQAIVKR